MQLQPLAHGERIDAMAHTIFHRGPDSGGKFQLPHVALAIRRLSIIDLETGNQPLSNEAGDITLVFNGEIYNYRELCEGLLDRGHHFRLIPTARPLSTCTRKRARTACAI